MERLKPHCKLTTQRLRLLKEPVVFTPASSDQLSEWKSQFHGFHSSSSKKYGAMLIGLALDGEGIPETVDDRIEVVKRIVNEGEKYNITGSRFLIDCLTLSAASGRETYKVTLEAMDRVKNELGLKTTLGASNVSYGLPNRDIVNGAFLSMAFAKGLDAPITDPLQPEIKKAIDVFAFFEDNEDPVSRIWRSMGNQKP